MKKKKKVDYYEEYCDLYDTWIVFFDINSEQAKKRVDKKYNVYRHTDDARLDNIENLKSMADITDTKYGGFTACGRCKKDGMFAVIIGVNLNPIDDNVRSLLYVLVVISHEAVHGTDAVFERKVMYSQDYRYGNEPYAYLVDYIYGIGQEFVTDYFTNVNDEAELKFSLK